MHSHNQQERSFSKASSEVVRSFMARTYHSDINLHQIGDEKFVTKTSRHHSEGDSRARQGFRNEVIALKVANEHNHIAKILAFDHWHMSMRLRLEAGKSLNEWADAANISILSTAECGMICKQMSSALAYLHALPIIHDDVKPDNIMWCRDLQHAVLIDFDAAIVMLPTNFNTSGTPNYAPPEYLLEYKSEKGDIWALGITMLFAFGYVPLPNGDWILPHALARESGPYEKMTEWLAQVEALRAGLIKANPLLAEMLNSDPDRRVNSRELSQRLELP
ncbi:hypothetical protein PFICI_05172 [Pestalotiopsis fici W106-1]|uniref:Protein kinase domain-containing protein n=1 Tax=Pestalotiopsis fici (strain W106-1 / CGMCC3.15140) TaxID=1229662 RepID=W3XDP0_PESFW|nr:uncharacterized protein PFICI_05172 [Pestalotiopsis fici W106-1]ETS83296.1 hypothetical protein PFICI_05172 [Pestalotiopsis fici W106-1]